MKNKFNIEKCSICGSDAKLIDWDFNDKWMVICDKNHMGKEFDTQEESVNYWNERQNNECETVEIYKNNPAKCIEQIEFCEFECDGGYLKNNIAWKAIKEILTKKSHIKT